MRVWLLRAAQIKLPAILLCAFAALIALSVALPHGDGTPATAKVSFSGIKDNAGRVALFSAYGWEVQDEPAQIVQVIIPREFDEVFTAYNELQKPLGLDLSRHRGAAVKRYTYVVENYEYDGTVYGNLLLRDGTLIGADICSANADGFLQPLCERAAA